MHVATPGYVTQARARLGWDGSARDGKRIGSRPPKDVIGFLHASLSYLEANCL